MSETNELIREIEKDISDAIDKFTSKIPASEKRTFAKALELLKDLKIKNGRIENSVENIKQIQRISQQLQKTIVDKPYLKDVAAFADAFNSVSELQHSYFGTLVSDFKPAKVLAAIRQDAITSTVNNLTDAGVSATVGKAIESILRTNITTGGMYADLVEQMRTEIIGNEKIPSKLSRYAKQITTDSLNQFSRTYNQTVTADLGFKWFQYVGSNVENTREFCKAMTKKRYYHVSELPSILRGKIDGKQVAINPKTKLWYGAIEDTNAINFQTNAGGWQCGHSIYGVPEILVPKSARDAIG